MIRKFRRFTAVVLTAAATALFATSCATAGNKEKPEAEKPAKRLKAALYLDSGSQGSGVFRWARLLEYSPQFELCFVNGKDVRDGKLAGVDMLVMPGGWSPSQYKAMREEGAQKVREFIRAGGTYVGTCAGLACTLNDAGRLKLLPFTRKQNAGGKSALIAVDFTEEGAKVMDIAPGRYVVRYSGGPIPLPGKAIPDGSGKILAIYKSTASYYDKPEGNFFDDGAVIFGTFGKGKVIATGFHPEVQESTHPIVAGCIYAVTGVKPTFEFPVKNRHPLRVGFWCTGTPDARRIRDMFDVDKNPDADMILTDSRQVEQGMLHHLDVLVVAHDSFGTCKKHLSGQYVSGQVKAFLERGGRIVVSGSGAESVPRHPNVIEVPVGASLAEAALRTR